jgi:hypothetical protein
MTLKSGAHSVKATSLLIHSAPTGENVPHDEEALAQKYRMGKANGSRECAPDDRLRVPTDSK